MTATPILAVTRSHAERVLSPILWRENPRIPRSCATVLEALKFTTVAPGLLAGLSEAEWQQALRFCDESRLTLLVGNAGRDHLPPWVTERIGRNLQGNVARLEALKQEYLRIASNLEEASVDHVVLKGFSHNASFCPDSRFRPQYDLDLWCREWQLGEARDAIARLGFETVTAQKRFPTDHLPPMVRKTGWDWKGDYFDPDMPPVVELHFRLWDEGIERLSAPGLDEFWARRRHEYRAGMSIPVMHAADQFAYAALHVLRHLLRGDLRALHVYEIAYFLHARKDDIEFWNEWRELHPEELRRLQGLACGLARKWFACDLPGVVATEISSLPRDVQAWFANYAASAIESKFISLKDELWLHLALLSSFRGKVSVVRRRMAPLNLPGRIESEFVPEQQRTMGGRLRGAVQYAGFLGSRALHHFRCWSWFVSSGVHWWRLRRGGRTVSTLAVQQQDRLGHDRPR